MTDKRYYSLSNLYKGTSKALEDRFSKPSNEGKILDNTSVEGPPLVGKFDNTLEIITEPSVNRNNVLEGKFEISYCRPTIGSHNDQIHFMNACRLQESVFTCAVDSFLEICFVGFSSFIKILVTKSQFFEILDRCMCQYNDAFALNSDCDEDLEILENHLAIIRQPVWDYLVTHCRSFSNRDGNAEFSEIFSSSIFNNLTEEEGNLFKTCYTLKTICGNCQEDVSVQSKIMLNYISEIDFRLLGDTNNWETLLDPLVRNRSLQCRCGNICYEIELESYSAPKICLLEFHKENNMEVKFREKIVIQGQQYALKGLVRHEGRHFSCAVLMDNRNWSHIDDLREYVSHYNELSQLYRHHNGWFFGLYIQDDGDGETINENIHFEIAEGFGKRKTKSVYKDYPLRSKKVRHEKSDYNKKYYEKNKDKAREYYEKNKDKAQENYEKNKDKVKDKVKDYYKKNKSKYASNYQRNKTTLKAKAKAYYDMNKEKIKAKKHEQYKIKQKVKTAKSDYSSNKFCKSLKMSIIQCMTCKEAWPISAFRKSKKLQYECTRCKKEKTYPKKFSIENDMVPSPVPLALQGLTQIEEMLIARAFPVIQVYTKPSGGQKAYKGHVLTLPHDVQHIANVLPRYPNDIPVIVFKFNKNDNNSKELRVRRQKIIDALIWLTGTNNVGEPNNPRYHDVTIDQSRFESLPEDDYLKLPMNVDFGSGNDTDFNNANDQNDDEGILPDMGPYLDDEPEEKVYDSNTEMGSFIPIKVKVKMEKEILNDSVTKSESLKLGTDALNEFTTEYLATMAFPTLFPDGKGDPTNSSTRRSVAKSDTESFSEKIKHLIKYAEFIDGKWVYRFAAHPRFGFWAYNMLYRRRLLGQGSFYLKQNPGEANLTIAELREMMENASYHTVMNKLLRYAKNIAGTNAYWNHAKEQLKATINQLGSPTIFWTLSCAEFHWPEYHALLSEENITDSSTLRDNIINNPHLIDWFFTARVENFVKYWLYERLGAEWHWYRFEYAVMRGSIHCHGIAKLKDDPGLCNLTQKALEGHLAQKQLTETSHSNDRLELELKVNEGNLAAQEVCDYVDSIVTACNPCTAENGWVKPKVHPCKKKLEDIDENDLDNDYADLVNCVQRHSKCSTAYCLRKKNNEVQKCRFDFPFDNCGKTFIEFEEINSKKNGKQYRPKIVLKRNDSRVNRHQRLQLQLWRANCDIQPIIDFHACLEYLAKYASKAEKISDVASSAFVSVVQNLKGSEQIRSIIQKLMIKAVGERDFSAQEVMHHILSLKLISSSYKVVNVSVDGSRKIEFKNDEVVTEASALDNYANRENLKGCDNSVLSSNFVQFISNYYVEKNSIKARKNIVIVRAFPSPSSNPNGPQFDVFCKYQLLKYKPWRTRISDAWDDLDVDEDDPDIFCCKWNEFLQSDLGQALVPNWRREFNNAELYFERSETDHFEENVQGEREEWMHLADLCVNESHILDSDTVDNNLQYWQSLRDNYSEEQIGNMVSWLDKEKENCESTREIFHLDVDSLNEVQGKAFEIIANHEKCPSEQLLMMITGLAGSGKSYLINSVRALLNEKCVVSAYFGIAAFNIKGITLHSLLNLPIRGKNQHDLKGQSLLRLQEKLAGVKYIIIDEYSVVGQNLLGWIDKRCRQGTGNVDKPFGGISIILVGDIAQLPPVGDKVLYHKKPNGEVGTMGFCMYRKFTTVIKLTVNERSKGNNVEQEKFRSALYRLRDGNSTEDDWNMFLSRTPGNVTEKLSLESFVKLSFSNEKVASDNHEALMSLKVPIAQINARHSNKAAAKIASDDMGGLEPKIFLSVGARVMLTRNLWTDKGLCNGSMGIVKEIIYQCGNFPPDLPIAVIVQFDSYSGPSFVIDQPRYVPIIPLTSASDLHGSSYERQQLPLRLSWAITIHKSQGLTLEKAWIDLGISEKFIGLAYVAMSRVRKLKDMIIEAMTLERLRDVKNRKDFKYREEEELRINELALKTI